MKKFSSKKQSVVKASDVTVTTVLLTRQIRYFDVKITIRGKSYIVSCVRDSQGRYKTDFKNVMGVDEKNVDAISEKIDSIVDTFPTDVNNSVHVRDNENWQRDFYSTGNAEADKFFSDAIKEGRKYSR
jgi:hypothetical protein